MNPIYETSFDGSPMRFVLHKGDVFVSRSDLYAVLLAGLPGTVRASAEEHLFNAVTNVLGDDEDHKGAILGQSEVGPAMHFHVAGSLVAVLSKLSDPRVGGHVELDAHQARLMERTMAYGQRVLSWFEWALTEAMRYFGQDFPDLHESVRRRVERMYPPMTVDIQEEGGIYTAVCDALGIVTEADTTDALIAQVYELVPDMVELNRPDLDPRVVRLSFAFAPPQMAQRRAG